MRVRGVHEFFANGLLVRNCDASRYAKINLLKLLREPIERTNPAVGPFGKPVKINRKRKWF